MSYSINASSLIGGLYLIILFIICFLIVCTLKIVVLYFKGENTAVIPTEKEPEAKPETKKRREIKTITLDPDDINRIQFKKSN